MDEICQNEEESTERVYRQPVSPWALENLPGDPMMWILIVSEILVFGGALWAFAGNELLNVEIYREARTHLNVPLATFNTIILLTSGLFAAIAVRFGRVKEVAKARLSLLGAGALGVVFMALKIYEYKEKLALGLNVETNTFYTLYYLVTGFHLAHVIFGLIILGIVALWPTEDNLESGTAFWHMVDLIWVIIFPIFYLMGQGV
ncbi:cytochrome c oxidase subunit 3 family protein [Pseudovibrio brasiliensis]|uniref:Cytochrome c oxidase subunit 3 family protein n=1 Tax=Pseudovibrio brasiliensis TaxID=1898042 RepID=A0ABX8ARG5_9HYPH|nr:cytochrome c oxidase subunit 3 family protein [Pseudovibrio brasiliensis]QUS57697.1 cytochrome c oxidase subunit 3 family protein [Pseudovibrio brasiliensis]